MVAAAVVLALSGPGAGAAGSTADWPGTSPATVADDAGALGGNISGLASRGVSGLWAVRDAPPALLALERSGDRWTPVAAWGDGRRLHYPNGRGGPDAEAVVVIDTDPGAVFVGAERDTDVPSRPRNSVLRYETGGIGALVATAEWTLDEILPTGRANTGLEGLTWVPDGVLVAAGLRDARGEPYVPAEHPAHHGGLFVVALEDHDELFVVRLAERGPAAVITTVPIGLATAMELHWDTDHGELWVLCDNTCDGRIEVLVPRDGTFVRVADLRPPSGSARYNDEGFVRLGCDATMSLVVWADDSATGDHVLRASRLPCVAIGELAAVAAPGASSTPRPPATSGSAGDSSSSGMAPGGGVEARGTGRDGGGAPLVLAALVVAAVLTGGVVVHRVVRRGVR